MSDTPSPGLGLRITFTLSQMCAGQAPTQITRFGRDETYSPVGNVLALAFTRHLRSLWFMLMKSLSRLSKFRNCERTAVERAPFFLSDQALLQLNGS